MEPCSNTPIGIHALNALLNALNIALVTWLVHRRARADQREHKRNGNGHAQHSTVAESLYPSESSRSAPGSTPKS